MNPEPFDVIVQVKESGTDLWESGQNRISIKTKEEEFDKKGYETKFIKFDINIDLEKSNDPRRAYTVLQDKIKTQRNGLELIVSQYLAIVQKK